MRIARIATLAAWLAVGGCGGGGGGLQERCIGFLAQADPAPATAVAREAAVSTCGQVAIVIVLTDVADVFAVEFTAAFDSRVAAYDGYSLADSHLASDGAQVLVLESKQPGAVSLGLARTNPSGGVSFTGSRALVRLLFRRAGTADAGPLAFSSTRILGSEQPPVEKPGIEWIGGTFQVR